MLRSFHRILGFKTITLGLILPNRKRTDNSLLFPPLPSLVEVLVTSLLPGGRSKTQDMWTLQSSLFQGHTELMSEKKLYLSIILEVEYVTFLYEYSFLLVFSFFFHIASMFSCLALSLSQIISTASANEPLTRHFNLKGFPTWISVGAWSST